MKVSKNAIMICLSILLFSSISFAKCEVWLSIAKSEFMMPKNIKDQRGTYISTDDATSGVINILGEGKVDIGNNAILADSKEACAALARKIALNEKFKNENTIKEVRSAAACGYLIRWSYKKHWWSGFQYGYITPRVALESKAYFSGQASKKIYDDLNCSLAEDVDEPEVRGDETAVQ